MTFADLAANDHIFLDANTLLYHFASHQVFGAPVNQLLTRIENQGLQGYTSTHVLSEAAHRLMMIEAATLPGWKRTSPATTPISTAYRASHAIPRSDS